MATPITRLEGEVMKVNTFIVEGPRGAVVVDGMLTMTDAHKVRDALDAVDKPLAGVVITHPHPDHYAGAAHIVGTDEVPIIATAHVDAVIRRDDATKEAIVGPMMGDEWPKERVFPNQLVSDGDTVALGGIGFRVRSLGAGESFADTVWEFDEETVFAGDVAYSGAHAYLADGQWESWLAVLDRLERELPDDVTLHVGHGPPGGKELLARQRRYIETFASSVRRHADAVAAGDHDPVLADMRRLLPSEDLLFLLDLSIAPMLDTLAPDPSVSDH
jgi:glyoxylase-like metal-dependent hydrolase (beta-lactamase superfamily II)